MFMAFFPGIYHYESQVNPTAEETSIYLLLRSPKNISPVVVTAMSKLWVGRAGEQQSVAHIVAPSPWRGIVSLIAVTWPRVMCDATLMMVSCCHDVTVSRRHVELENEPSRSLKFRNHGESPMVSRCEIGSLTQRS